MGGAGLEILALSPEGDPSECLAARLLALAPRLILTGTRAEVGEGSGLLPYVLAHRLRRPLVSGCVSAAIESAGTIRIIRALPGGARQTLLSEGPLVMSVGPAAPAPHLSAFAPSRRKPVMLLPVEAARDPRHERPASPARPMPRPITKPSDASPIDRLSAILSGAGGNQTAAERIEGASPEAAAAAILAYLRSAGLAPGSGTTESPL
jgi:electron transfer flavoprotein beta subunit